MNLQAWLIKDKGLKSQFLAAYITRNKYIAYHRSSDGQTYFISEASVFNSNPEQHAVIESFQNLSKVAIGISNNTFEQLKKDFRVFKFNLKNKNENRVKKQLFIDQKTMIRFEEIIKNNKLDTVQNGLSFLMDGLSLRMRQEKEMNRQNTIKMQFQHEQLSYLQQQKDQYKTRNKALIIQHNKKLEKLSNALSNYVTKDFKQQLHQSLENILDQHIYTEVIDSNVISLLLDKLSEKIKVKIDETTSMIEVQDLNPRD